MGERGWFELHFNSGWERYPWLKLCLILRFNGFYVSWGWRDEVYRAWYWRRETGRIDKGSQWPVAANEF